MKLPQLLLDLFGPPTGGPNHVDPPAAATHGADRILQLVRQAGGRWERVVITRNARIMASVGREGRDLRLHESFLEAPDRVLLAIPDLFGGRRGARRSRARATVRDFIAGLPPSAPASRSRPRSSSESDARQLARLQAEFDRVNAEHFSGALPRVPIFLSDRMRSRNGHFSSAPLEIVISRRLCTHGVPGEAEHTVRHEMVHLWQFASGTAVDHGADFRRMARRLDVHPRATRQVRWSR